ncbi:hypothetical protein MTO96_048893 [Rhipicephalus appendiculatus]
MGASGGLRRAADSDSSPHQEIDASKHPRNGSRITMIGHKSELIECAVAPQKTESTMSTPISGSTSTLLEERVKYGATTETSTAGGLKREVGLFSAVAIIIGSTVGSGILVTPSLVFRHTGTIGVSLLVWLAAGAMALINALCLSELGSLVPASGGEYAYLCAAADSLGRPGDFVAFMAMWGNILLADPLITALQSLTFTSYALTPFYPTCQPPYGLTILVAIAFSTLASAVNCISLGVSTNIQNIFSMIKVFMLLAIISTGIAAISTGTNHMKAPFISGDVTAIGLTEAYFAAFMSMGGGASVCNIGEEVKNPSQTILRALILSSIVVTALYIFTNLAYFVVLDPEVIASVDATAAVFATEAWGMAGTLIIPMLASISTFGTLSATSFSQSRLRLRGLQKGTPAFFLIAHIGQVFCTRASCLRPRSTGGGVRRDRLCRISTLNIAILAINVWKSRDYVKLIVLGAVLLAGVAAYLFFLVKRCAFPGVRGLTRFLQKLFMCQACENNAVIDKPSLVLAPTRPRRAAECKIEKKAS